MVEANIHLISFLATIKNADFIAISLFNFGDYRKLLLLRMFGLCSISRKIKDTFHSMYHKEIFRHVCRHADVQKFEYTLLTHFCSLEEKHHENAFSFVAMVVYRRNLGLQSGQVCSD